MFDGVRKPVSAQQLLECGVLDKPTFNKLIKGEKTVPEVSVDKKISLKGTGPIAGVKVGSSEKMSISEAKKRMLLPPESADLLLEAQAATGHIIDPMTNQKLTVEEACARGVVDRISVDKKISLKGTGPIAGVKVGSSEKMSISEAKKRMLLPPESADLLLEAQAATGHIIDPISNQKLTVEEACSRGVVDRNNRDKLLAAESAAVGFKDPHTGKSLSVFEAMKKALIDKKTGLRLLQAQESAGGILDPNLSVFLSKETAVKCSLLDQDLVQALTQNSLSYIDPDTEHITCSCGQEESLNKYNLYLFSDGYLDR
uniref:DESP n=1 Tax=Xiphophorus couchianus TaxID=32473 RepID=A0A3B5L1S7_9TELE